MSDARHKAILEAQGIPGDVADALVKGQQDVESGMQTLTDLMNDKWTDASRIAYYKGILTSQELANGLRSQDADVRSAAEKVKSDAEYQLRLLETGAADIAAQTGVNLSTGLNRATQPAAQAAAAMRGAINKILADQTGVREGAANVGTAWADALAARLNGDRWKVAQALYGYKVMLIGLSPPKEGPLKDIDTGAYNIGKSWHDNFNRGLGGDDDLNLPTIPDLAPGGGVAGGAAGGMGTGGVLELHAHLYLDGKEIAEEVSRYQYYGQPKLGILGK
jgi:hypothetical protein